MQCIITNYTNCSNEEIKTIASLIIRGGEVNTQTLDQKLRRAISIGVVKDNNKIIGTASIKLPKKTYLRNVFVKSNSETIQEKFRYELGYIFVDPDYRGKHLGYSLCKCLIDSFGEHSLFATTRTDNGPMRHILQLLGFQATGNFYEGRNGVSAIQL